MWKYKYILYFLFKRLSSGPNTIYQKFHLFSSYVKHSFNHRTNVLVHKLIIYIFSILFHFFLSILLLTLAVLIVKSP